jgi:hypothetical protein
MSHLLPRPRLSWGLVVLYILTILFVAACAFALGRIGDSPTTLAATASTDQTVDADAARLAAVEAERVGCRSLTVQVVSVAKRLDHQFHLHHEAHKAMIKGEISQEERNKVWATTLAARVELSALLRQAINQAEARDC